MPRTPSRRKPYIGHSLSFTSQTGWPAESRQWKCGSIPPLARFSGKAPVRGRDDQLRGTGSHSKLWPSWAEHRGQSIVGKIGVHLRRNAAIRATEYHVDQVIAPPIHADVDAVLHIFCLVG